MIPVTQTKVVINNSKGEMVQRGNCVAACIASLLDMRIEDVPNVETLFDVSDTYWYEVLSAFLKTKGLELCTDNRFKVFHDGRYGVEGRNRHDWWVYARNKYYLVSGQSPRGVMHVCIYLNGQMVHDPHPSREGLLTLDYFEAISPIN